MAIKSKNLSGLRVLSLKVKDIVCEKKETSYKEVAESLIGEAGSKIRGKSMNDANVIITIDYFGTYAYI